MRYIEIGQDLVDAIRGGADYDGKKDVDEIVGNIDGIGDLMAYIAATIKQIFEALKAFLKL